MAAARMIRWSLIVFLSEGRNGHYHSYRKSALDVEIVRRADGVLLGLNTSTQRWLSETATERTAAGMVFGAGQDLSSVKADWGQAHSFVRLLFR